MARSAWHWILMGFSLASGATGETWAGFDMKELPPGNQITMPQPATTLAPVVSRLQLSSTERKQTLKFTVVNIRSGAVRPVQLAIYDPARERVQNVTVHPGVHAIYKLEKLSTIAIVQKTEGVDPSVADSEGLRLMIESDKPLGVQH